MLNLLMDNEIVTFLEIVSSRLSTLFYPRITKKSRFCIFFNNINFSFYDLPSKNQLNTIQSSNTKKRHTREKDRYNSIYIDGSEDGSNRYISGIMNLGLVAYWERIR
jgi:hypothetical protein